MTTPTEQNTAHVLNETARIRQTDPELWRMSNATLTLFEHLREGNDIEWTEEVALGAVLYADFLMNTIGDMIDASEEILMGDYEGAPDDLTEDQIIDTANVLAHPKLISFLQTVQVGVMRSAADEFGPRDGRQMEVTFNA